MKTEFTPLLQVQRDLLDQPRGFVRFQTYLKTMIGADGEVALPLAAFNPMSKDHVATVLDKLLSVDAEAAAADAMQQSAAQLQGIGALRAMPSYRVGLVVADDAQGGWTNRYLFEAKEFFENKYALRHGFISVLLWSSDAPSLDRVRRETAAAIFRTAWLWTHGLPTTLGDMLQQEGWAARFAGAPAEHVDASEALKITRLLDSRDYPTQMTCLYGDDVAETLGYAPLGIAAGLAMRFAVSDRFLGPSNSVEALTQRVRI